MDYRDPPEADRIRELARQLAETDAAAGQLAGELADAVAALTETVGGLSARVDALWQLISAVVESAGLSAPDGPRAEFEAAVERAHSTGRRDVRLNVDGRQWVAALSQQPPRPDRASWSAIERLARQAGDQDEI